MDHSDVIELVQRYRGGDERAAHDLFEHYARRLIPIAGKRMSAGLRQRLDPEDLVQSAMGSFIRRDRNDPFPLESPGHLWSLLLGMVVNKVRQHVRSSLTLKSDFRREVGDDRGVPQDAPDNELLPDIEASLQEQWSLVTGTLRPLERRVLEMHLGGHDVASISAAVARAEGRVRHVLSDIACALKERLQYESSTTQAAISAPVRD